MRDRLMGMAHDHDRLWLLHTPEFVGVITEYNFELTGYSPELGKLDPETFRYGGNAYYVLNVYSKQRGWRVEPCEDRRL